jgi:hypothetical protein
MSAAATAAGYLYASGRLRGRNGREQEHHEHRESEQHKAPEREPRRVKVAVYQKNAQQPAAAQPTQPPAAPKKTPKIEYRTRRWRPE